MSRGRRGAWAVFAGLLFSAFAAQASPDAAVPAVEDARTKALSLLHEGNELAGDGEYVEALEKFRAAYALFPSPKLLLNIGTSLRVLGRNPEAAEAYERFLKDPQHEAKRDEEVKRILGEIDSVVGRLHIRVRMAGAKVRLDGRELGAAPLDVSLRVEPGEHTIVADEKGMSADVETVTVKKGEVLTVDAEPTPPGVVTKTERVETGTAQRISGIVIGSVGIGGLIAGAGLGGAAMATNNQAKKECWALHPNICSANSVSLGHRASTEATASTIAFVGGATLTGLGAILFFTAPSGKKAQKTSPTHDAASPRPTALVIAPPGGGGVGATLVGEW